MKARNGSATPLLLLALVISVMINFVTGCETVRDILGIKEPEPKVVKVEDVEAMRSVAKSLGLNVSEKKTASDIATDIKILVDNSTQEMPATLSDENIKLMKQMLTREECKVLDDYQRVVKEAQGKRVLYLPKGEEE
jgi:uncharacterized protein (UPF0254 family)